MGRCYKNILAWCILVSSLSLITFFAVLLIGNWNLLKIENKISVMGYLAGGTLSLGALTLTVLAHALSRVRAERTANRKAPYIRLALISYFISPLSFTTSFVSIVFILTKVAYSFEISIFLFSLIIVGVINMVTLWVLNAI